jgi:glutamyl-Q tRNA(Asp) synthetase
VAGLASYLDARANDGAWLVRIEDVDETRTRRGAADHILHTLERLGMTWDEEVVYQTSRKALYRAIIQQLLDRDAAYPCACSRADIARSARNGVEGPIYAGTCRNGIAAGRRARALRLCTEPREIRYRDRVLGPQSQDVHAAVGDFVVHRADGFTAYQLAVVVDDQAQRISHVVRGADLLHSTARQIYLQQLLGYRTPEYAHVPLVLDSAGRKLSKSAGDAAISGTEPVAQLLRAYRFLGQRMPPPLPETLDEFWSRAIAGWRLDHLEARNDATHSL